jgi:hypothetical protein
MSTAALASARRRRTTNENPAALNANTNANVGVNRAVQQVQKDVPQVQNQTLTPLQILQIHDVKIKDLETIITEFTDEELLSKFIDDKMEGYMLSKHNESESESTQAVLNDPNRQIMDKNIEGKIELQNNKMDEFKTSIRELINNIKEENTNIQNQLRSNNDLLNDKLMLKFEKFSNLDNITSEFNELKLLVIKSQNIALETSNNINKLYVDKVAEFLEEKCDMTQPQKKERIDQLWEISNSIDLCKTAAEDCRSLKEAELLYNEAVDLLNKMNDKC